MPLLTMWDIKQKRTNEQPKPTHRQTAVWKGAGEGRRGLDFGWWAHREHTAAVTTVAYLIFV